MGENIDKPIAIYLDKFSTYKINHKNATDKIKNIYQVDRGYEKINLNYLIVIC